LIDDIAAVAPPAFSTQTQLRTLLGCFLFTDDEVFKPIRVLSGGERNRYALARMLLRPRNFLLLDEPTNHLDLRAKDVLLDALRNFTGTVLFVSHDRYFIDQLASRIFEIEQGEFRDYAGNYEDYLWQKEHHSAAAPDLDGQPPPRPEQPDEIKLTTPAPEPRARKLNPILVRQKRERREHLEEEIARCEAEIAACETDLGTFKSAEESIRLTRLIGENRTRIEEMMEEWEQLAVELEEV
jgi:ATP-binding cassette subfamily F protein 3